MCVVRQCLCCSYHTAAYIFSGGSLSLIHFQSLFPRPGARPAWNQRSIKIIFYSLRNLIVGGTPVADATRYWLKIERFRPVVCVYTWFGSFLFRSYYMYIIQCVCVHVRSFPIRLFSLISLFIFSSLFFLSSFSTLSQLNKSRKASISDPTPFYFFLSPWCEGKKSYHSRTTAPFFHLFLLLPFLRECRTSLASCAALFHT